MTTYSRLTDVHSDTEPKEERKYGSNGVDYCHNIRHEGNGYVYDILRFENEDDYVRYRKIHG